MYKPFKSSASGADDGADGYPSCESDYWSACSQAGPSDDHVLNDYAAGGYEAYCSPAQSGLSSQPSHAVARPLRVIHVGQNLLRAGIEMWLKALITGMDPRRVEFVRCVVTSSWCDPELVREFPVPVEVGGKSSVQRAAADCDLLLVSGPPELAQWLGPGRPPCVFVAHGDGIWTRRILERSATAIDHVVAVSRRAQQMVCHGFPTTVIHNGVDASHLSRTTHRHDMRHRLGYSPDDFVIGSVMRLAMEKRPELLVEALAQLPRHVKLLLVGWGALQQKLLDLANRIAPMRCSITSAQGNLGDFYQAFDAFCLPSEFEGFGLATLEALLCGVPVVTTNTGFAPELLQDRVHYCQCELSAESVASSMRLLIEHPRWAAGMAAEGRFAAEQFGFASRMCREYEQLIEELVAQRRAARSAMDKSQSKRDGIIGTSQCP